MNIVILEFISLFALFALLAWAADLTVKNIKIIASALKLKVFILGIILGFFTSLPELSVGLNATIEGVASLSVGNLLGGVIVIIGLIIGASLILNRKIKTNSSFKMIVPIAIAVLLSLLLGSDGKYSKIDGFIIVFLYLGLLFYFWLTNKTNNATRQISINKKKVIKALFFSFLGAIMVILTSDWIVDIAVEILERTGISKLAIGLLVFSIGTNLPEITITLTSWKKKAAELSLSHLTSSFFANILILGLLASMRPINVVIGPAFFLMSFFLSLILILFLYFCYSKRKLDRREGIILLAVYFLFLISSIILVGI